MVGLISPFPLLSNTAPVLAALSSNRTQKRATSPVHLSNMMVQFSEFRNCPRQSEPEVLLYFRCQPLVDRVSLTLRIHDSRRAIIGSTSAGPTL
jgi:hypothetical protein